LVEVSAGRSSQIPLEVSLGSSGASASASALYRCDHALGALVRLLAAAAIGAFASSGRRHAPASRASGRAIGVIALAAAALTGALLAPCRSTSGSVVRAERNGDRLWRRLAPGGRIQDSAQGTDWRLLAQR
jgi:hypothetical protein